MSERPDIEGFVAEARNEMYQSDGGIAQSLGIMIADLAIYALDLEAEVAQLRADREREKAVVEFVRSLEHVTDDGDDWEFCGICHNYLTRHPEAGHAKDCRLVPVLAALQAAGEPRGEEEHA